MNPQNLLLPIFVPFLLALFSFRLPKGVKWLREIVSTDAASIAVMRPGRRVEVKQGSRTYSGSIYAESTVLVVHGKVEVRELHVLTINPWQLSDDAYLPEGTCITARNGAYEVTSLAALKAAETGKEAYIKNALAEIDDAAAQQDWARAKRVLAEAQARFPGAGAIEKRAAALRVELASPTINVADAASFPLTLRLLQGGTPVVATVLGPGEAVAIRVPKGVYVGEWSGPTGGTTETVTVDRSQTWVFDLMAHADVVGMSPEPRWTRTVK
jgi:hypothetical protein